MSSNIAYKIRMAMQVATACAEEILNPWYLRDANSFERPCLLSMPTNPNQAMIFRFERGVVINVVLFDFRKDTLMQAQDWRVMRVHVRYINYARTESHEIWGERKLNEVRSHRPWKDPKILSAKNTWFRVGAFHDEATDKFAGTDVHPYRKLGKQFRLVWEEAFDPSVPDDQLRAEEAAAAQYERGVQYAYAH